MRPFARGLLALVFASCAVAASVWADPANDDGVAPAPAQGAASDKPIDLDRLLHPPAGALQPNGKTYGGRDQKGWLGEFKRARQEVSDLEGKIEAEQEKLRNVSSNEWNYAPGGGEVTDPEVLKLRATLRRDRQSLEASRQRLRDLDVEASLAGVPEEWRQPPTDVGSHP
jgi:hypothetical protein